MNLTYNMPCCIARRSAKKKVDLPWLAVACQPPPKSDTQRQQQQALSQFVTEIVQLQSASESLHSAGTLSVACRLSHVGRRPCRTVASSSVTTNPCHLSLSLSVSLLLAISSTLSQVTFNNDQLQTQAATPSILYLPLSIRKGVCSSWIDPSPIQLHHGRLVALRLGLIDARLEHLYRIIIAKHQAARLLSKPCHSTAPFLRVRSLGPRWPLTGTSTMNPLRRLGQGSRKRMGSSQRHRPSHRLPGLIDSTTA